MDEPNPPAHVRDDERLDAELQRLAHLGAQQRSSLETAAEVERQRAANRRLRYAIGAYRGSAMKRTVLAILTVCSLAGVVIVLVSAPMLAVVVISLAGTLLLVAVLLVAPLASKGAIAAEAQWVASLPFRLEGYFELLSGTPEVTRIIIYDVSWAGGHTPDTTFLQNVVAAIDPKASVEHSDAGRARIISGPVLGLTSVKKTPSSYVTANHGIPPSVHTLVEQVLLSVHLRYPLARVSLTSR